MQCVWSDHAMDEIAACPVCGRGNRNPDGRCDDHPLPKPNRGGRPRIHATDADRHRAHRQRKATAVSDVVRLVDAIEAALERGRSWALLRGLPDEPAARMTELARRLDEVNLVKFRRDYQRRTKE